MEKPISTIAAAFLMLSRITIFGIANSFFRGKNVEFQFKWVSSENFPQNPDFFCIALFGGCSIRPKMAFTQKGILLRHELILFALVLIVCSFLFCLLIHYLFVYEIRICRCLFRMTSFLGSFYITLSAELNFISMKQHSQ